MGSCKLVMATMVLGGVLGVGFSLGVIFVFCVSDAFKKAVKKLKGLWR